MMIIGWDERGDGGGGVTGCVMGRQRVWRHRRHGWLDGARCGSTRRSSEGGVGQREGETVGYFVISFFKGPYRLLCYQLMT